MKKLLAGICLLSSLIAYSQRSGTRNGIVEFGLMLGASNYFGDLAPEITTREFNPSIGILYKYHHSKYFSSRYQLAFAKISGDDQNFKSNQYRSIKFESNIYEAAYMLEFNFKPFGYNPSHHEETKTTYVFGGVSMFMFNPTAKLPGGDKVDLRDFGTEGQKLEGGPKQYSLIQPAIIMGLGYKLNVRKTVIGLEIGFRKTFTDYLDDVSKQYPDYGTLSAAQGVGAAEFSQPQTMHGGEVIKGGSMRGDPHLKDWYFIVGITISFRDVVGDLCP